MCLKVWTCCHIQQLKKCGKLSKCKLYFHKVCSESFNGIASSSLSDLKSWKSPQWVSFSTFLLCAIQLLIVSNCMSLLPLLPLVLMYFLLLNALFIFFQVPFASFPSAPVLLASTLSSPVTRRTCTACQTTLVMAMAGLCFAPGEALASPSFLASSAPWLLPFNQYPDPPAPSPDKRMALSAKPYGRKKTDWSHTLTTNKQTKTKKTCDRFIYPLITWLQFSICVLKIGVLMICYFENNRKKTRN